MEIKLRDTLVRSLHLDRTGEEFDLELKYGPRFREGVLREFAVAFELRVPLKPGGDFRLKFLALFDTDEDISEEFRRSHFPRVNAPAVAYPYVRAFVSQFAVLSGFDLYTLPIRNFVKVAPMQEPLHSPSEPGLPPPEPPTTDREEDEQADGINGKH